MGDKNGSTPIHVTKDGADVSIHHVDMAKHTESTNHFEVLNATHYYKLDQHTRPTDKGKYAPVFFDAVGLDATATICMSLSTIERPRIFPRA